MSPNDRHRQELESETRVGDPKCAGPFCENRVSLRGLYCASCIGQQKRQAEAMRAYHQKQRAEKRAS